MNSDSVADDFDEHTIDFSEARSEEDSEHHSDVIFIDSDVESDDEDARVRIAKRRRLEEAEIEIRDPIYQDEDALIRMPKSMTKAREEVVEDRELTIPLLQLQEPTAAGVNENYISYFDCPDCDGVFYHYEFCVNKPHNR